MHAPILVALNQSRVFEHAQMLRDGRESHVVRRGQIADGSLAERELREDAAARGVGKSAKGSVEGRS
jgi:hypothetical protein